MTSRSVPNLRQSTEASRRTVSLEDMRLFAAVATAGGFTQAARALGVPKQTLSRRVAGLEEVLGVALLLRSTRRVKLTDAGAAYRERCEELVRLAADANRAVAEVHEVPRGLLRVTADPVFGDAFVTALVNEYATAWPETRLDVMLTRRHVDLVEERFDVAFRVGRPDDASLSGVALGPARVRLCASPAYVARRGTPKSAEDLARHDCIVVTDGGVVHQWPVPSAAGPRRVSVAPRLTFTSFAMAHAAALAGLGVALFPEFACADDLRRKRLITVLGQAAIDVGSVWLLYPAQRFMPARTRAFVDLARERFAREGALGARSARRRKVG
ncbi:MAG: LysR family transcriptional regulator [Polyangiaceae bacterium]